MVSPSSAPVFRFERGRFFLGGASSFSWSSALILEPRLGEHTDHEV